MDDAQDLYGNKEYSMRGKIRVGNSEIESNGRRYQETPPDIAATMRSLRVEMQSYRDDNERMVRAQE